MPKTKAEKAKAAAAPVGKSVWRGVLPHLVGLILLAGVLGAAIYYGRKFVNDTAAVSTGPLNVVLKDQPSWMSDFLAQQIAATVPHASGSAFDREILVDAVKRLQANPWVKEVHSVRRVYGQRPGDTLEVDCEYRAPIALVNWGDYYWLVDGEGMKLPEPFTARHVPNIVVGRDGKMNIRIIDGVHQPPPDTGKKWQGSDLAAGLGMVKVLFGKPFTEEIVSVDVSNFAGRKDPREAQLVLKTKYGTQVRWGRPIDAKDFFAEVPVNQKLETLKAVVTQYGRVDANRPWIDIRYDKITYPTPETAQVDNGQ